MVLYEIEYMDLAEDSIPGTEWTVEEAVTEEQVRAKFERDYPEREIISVTELD